MAAIDLLLNWSPRSERMHQVVLAGLLRHTRLLEMFGVGGIPIELKVETQSRLYDFTVMVLDGNTRRAIHIELKVDAALENDQITRQMAAVAPSDVLLYVLIGVTRFTWTGERLETLRAKLEKAPQPEAVRIIDLNQMRDAVSALAADAVDENHRDLAVAYGSLLRRIHSSTNEFESKPLSEWSRCGYEWFGLFSEMVCRLGLADAGMDRVYNPTHPFVGCWWDFEPLNLAAGSEAYLQCEEDLLCFKVAVYDGDRASVRDRFSREVLTAAGQLGFPAKKPGRFGNGTWMTVAVMDGDYRRLPGESLLNWNHLSQTLRAASAVLDLAVHNCSGATTV